MAAFPAYHGVPVDAALHRFKPKSVLSVLRDEVTAKEEHGRPTLPTRSAQTSELWPRHKHQSGSFARHFRDPFP